MKHRVVKSGTWLYDDTVEMLVYIVELDYDFWHEMAKSDGMLEADDKPVVNSEGRRYYVCFREVPQAPPIWVNSPGHDSLADACEDAQSKVASVITWM